MSVAKIRGRVVGGNRIGRTLGFPTANIVIDARAELRDGVYAARASVGGEVYEGMANVGYKPTVSGISGGEPKSDGVRLLEVNLFGFEGDLYGRTIEVELLEFVRPEMSFDSLDRLKAAVDDDRREIEKYFKLR